MSDRTPPKIKNKNRLKEVEAETERFVVEVTREIGQEARRWPALVALLIIGLAFAILSERYTIGPSWLLLPVVAVLVIPAIVSRLRGYHQLNHLLLQLIIGLVTLAEVVSISLLLLSLPDKSIAGAELLRDAIILWVTNIFVFALWYWQIDGGGPYQRHQNPHYSQKAALLFPQLIPGCPGLTESEEWRPEFIDYLFVAFNTSTAFSPTDTPVLGRPIKVLSMLQSVLSLVTLVTLAARAINIL